MGRRAKRRGPLRASTERWLLSGHVVACLSRSNSHKRSRMEKKSTDMLIIGIASPGGQACHLPGFRWRAWSTHYHPPCIERTPRSGRNKKDYGLFKIFERNSKEYPPNVRRRNGARGVGTFFTIIDGCISPDFFFCHDDEGETGQRLASKPANHRCHATYTTTTTGRTV